MPSAAEGVVIINPRHFTLSGAETVADSRAI